MPLPDRIGPSRQRLIRSIYTIAVELEAEKKTSAADKSDGNFDAKSGPCAAARIQTLVFAS